MLSVLQWVGNRHIGYSSQHWGKESFNKALQKFARDNNLDGDGLTFYSLRYTIIGLMNHSGITTNDIGKLTGHSTSVVQAYIRDEELEKMRYNLLNKFHRFLAFGEHGRDYDTMLNGESIGSGYDFAANNVSSPKVVSFENESKAEQLMDIDQTTNNSQVRPIVIPSTNTNIPTLAPSQLQSQQTTTSNFFSLSQQMPVDMQKLQRIRLGVNNYNSQHVQSKPSQSKHVQSKPIQSTNIQSNSVNVNATNLSSLYVNSPVIPSAKIPKVPFPILATEHNVNEIAAKRDEVQLRKFQATPISKIQMDVMIENKRKAAVRRKQVIESCVRDALKTVNDRNQKKMEDMMNHYEDKLSAMQTAHEDELTAVETAHEDKVDVMVTQFIETERVLKEKAAVYEDKAIVYKTELMKLKKDKMKRESDAAQQSQLPPPVDTSNMDSDDDLEIIPNVLKISKGKPGEVHIHIHHHHHDKKK